MPPVVLNLCIYDDVPYPTFFPPYNSENIVLDPG